MPDEMRSRPAGDQAATSDRHEAIAQSNDIRAYLNTCLGDSDGYLHIAAGADPYLDDKGKYRHHRWGEYAYPWPAEADRAEREILDAATQFDVYACPYVMRGVQRAKWAAVTHTLVHADVDVDLDLEKVRTLGAFAVASGSHGHGHVYVALADPVSGPQHLELCRGLGRYLGATDAKITDNDLLRPPGTFNFKPTVAGGEPLRVGWRQRP